MAGCRLGCNNGQFSRRDYFKVQNIKTENRNGHFVKVELFSSPLPLQILKIRLPLYDRELIY